MWAIKIPFEDSFLYITETDDFNNIRLLLFDTKQAAEEQAKIWKTFEVVNVKCDFCNEPLTTKYDSVKIMGNRYLRCEQCLTEVDKFAKSVADGSTNDD